MHYLELYFMPTGVHRPGGRAKQYRCILCSAQAKTVETFAPSDHMRHNHKEEWREHAPISVPRPGKAKAPEDRSTPYAADNVNSCCHMCGYSCINMHIGKHKA